MTKKHKKRNNSFYLYLIIGFISIFLFFIVLEIFYHDDPKTIDQAMESLGYQLTDGEDAFYKKNVTNNTLEQFYDDVSKKKNVEFVEFSVTKDSFDFIEQKLQYYNGSTANFNFSSNLTSEKVIFLYEYDGNGQYLMLEGNSENNYQCGVISQTKMTKNDLIHHCDVIQTELNTYFQYRSEVLNQSAILKVLQKK